MKEIKISEYRYNIVLKFDFITNSENHLTLNKSNKGTNLSDHMRNYHILKFVWAHIG